MDVGKDHIIHLLRPQALLAHRLEYQRHRAIGAGVDDGRATAFDHQMNGDAHGRFVAGIDGADAVLVIDDPGHGTWRKPRQAHSTMTGCRRGVAWHGRVRWHISIAQDPLRFMRIADIRQEYMRAGLIEKDAAADPFKQFDHWLHDALLAELPLPNAMTLATAAGRPSARV